MDFGGGRNPDGLGFAAFGYIVEGRDVLDKIMERAENDEYLVNEIVIYRVRRACRVSL